MTAFRNGVPNQARVFLGGTLVLHLPSLKTTRHGRLLALHGCGIREHTHAAFGRSVAQPGRAPALGAGCRRFESCRSDHFFFNGPRGTTALMLVTPPFDSAMLPFQPFFPAAGGFPQHQSAPKRKAACDHPEHCRHMSLQAHGRQHWEFFPQRQKCANPPERAARAKEICRASEQLLAQGVRPLHRKQARTKLMAHLRLPAEEAVNTISPVTRHLHLL